MHTASCAGAAAYGNRSHRTPINAAEAASSQDFKATLTQTVGSAPINVKDFGAKANPLFDDHSYIQAAFEAAMSSGRPLYFPAGTYYVKASQLQLVLNKVQTTGFTIYGDGPSASIINVEAVPQSPQVLIGCTNLVEGDEKGAPPGSNHNAVLRDLSIVANTPGIAVQLGLPGVTNPTKGTQTGYTDPMNMPEIDIKVRNNSAAPTARAIVMNYVLGGVLDFDASVAGPGYSLVLNQTAFSEISGTFTTSDGTGIWLTEGYNAGNIFNNVTINGAANAVVQNNAQSVNNTFVGGKISYRKSGVFSSAGDHLLFINPQAIPFGGATPAMFFGASKGVNVRPLGRSISSRLPLRMPNLSQTQVVNVKDFGAKAVDGVDDSEAISKAFQAALASNKPLYFPAGRYWTGDKQVLFSLGSQARSITIFGDGGGKSIIDCRGAKTSPQILVRDTTYAKLKMVGLGVWGQTDGITFQIGTDGFDDSLQQAVIDLKVSNFSSAPTARAVLLNDVRSSTIRLIANTAGAGYGMVLRQAISNYFSGSYGSWKGTSIWLRDGQNVGNSFVSLDMENVNINVISDSARNADNTFWGGTFSYSQAGVFSNAGSGLYIVNPNINPTFSNGQNYFIGNKVGLNMIY